MNFIELLNNLPGLKDHGIPVLRQTLNVVRNWQMSSMLRTISYALVILICKIGYSQTYSKVISDEEIVNFINQDILRDSIEGKFQIWEKIVIPHLDAFYYKDSADFYIKNKSSSFIFQRNEYKGRTYSYFIDTLFKRPDIEFFKTQINGLKKQKKWIIPFVNSEFIKTAELDSNNYAKQIMYSYSPPIFSADKKRAIIIKAFYCGLLCGYSAYYIYQRNENDTWRLIKKIQELSE